jgi:hypothetical protein
LFVLSGRTIRVSSHPRLCLSFRQSPSGDEESHPLVSEGIASANNSANKLGSRPAQPSPLLVIPTEPFGRRGISSVCKLRGGFCQQFGQQIGLPPPRERGDDLFVLSGRTIRVSSHPRHRLSFRRKPFGRRGISSACKLRDCFCQQFGQQFCQQNWAPAGAPPPLLVIPTEPFGRRGISSACKLRGGFCQQFCQQIRLPPAHPRLCLSFRQSPSGDEESHPFVI